MTTTLGEGHQGHPVIDYKVSVSRNKKPSIGHYRMSYYSPIHSKRIAMIEG